MMVDNMIALALLERRLNLKQPYDFHDLNIITAAVDELKQLRKTVAVLDAELNKVKQ